MENIDNSLLFFKIWRNIVIKNEIQRNIKLIQFRYKTFNSVEKIKAFSNLMYVTEILYVGEIELQKGDLPESGGVLKVVSFVSSKYTFNDGSVIPDGVHTIEFPYGYKLPVNLSNLPNSLKRMKNVFVQDLDDDQVLETNQLESIVFSSSFKSKLSNNTFPKSSKLKHLSMGVNWNNGNKLLQKGDLPFGLEILEMPYYIQDIGIGVIPSTVKKLMISNDNETTLTIGSIPPSVKELTTSEFGEDLIIPAGAIPDSIEKFTSLSYKLSLEVGSLPNQLVEFTLLSNLIAGEIGQGILPLSLKKLVVTASNTPIAHGALPNGLETLIYDPNPVDLSLINYQSLLSGPLQPGFFPSSITNLEIGRITTDEYPLTPGIIPNSVKSLKLAYGFNSPLIKDMLPDSVTELEISSVHTKFKIKKGSLPSSITSLIISSSTYDKPIKQGLLPDGLKKLIFTNTSVFNHSLDIVGILQPSLTHLEFAPSNFDNPITKPNVLPSSLKTLIFHSSLSGDDFNLVSPSALPPFCK